MSGAAVVRVFCRIEDDGSYQLQFDPSYKISKNDLDPDSTGRIRHVIGGPDGALYVLLQKRIVRMTPAQ